jgi:hypothetical protein
MDSDCRSFLGKVRRNPLFSEIRVLLRALRMDSQNLEPEGSKEEVYRVQIRWWQRLVQGLEPEA